MISTNVPEIRAYTRAYEYVGMKLSIQYKFIPKIWNKNIGLLRKNKVDHLIWCSRAVELISIAQLNAPRIGFPAFKSNRFDEVNEEVYTERNGSLSNSH